MQIKLGAIGQTVTGLEDINQELGLILGTPLGSVPHMPEFGSLIYDYVDMPVDIARPLIIAEAWRAIKANSERFKISDVVLLNLAAGSSKFKISGAIADSKSNEEIVLDVMARG